MERNKQTKIVVSICVIMLLVGIGFLSSNYIMTKVESSYNEMNLELLALTDEDVEYEETLPTTEPEKKKEEVDPELYNYVGKITIDKINLNQGFVSKNSKYNNVNYGIATDKRFNTFGTNKGITVLLAHSGTSYISFFKNLYKLSLEDEIKIEYKGTNYTYVIKNIYTVPKGSLTLKYDDSKTNLALVTCTKNDKKTQTVYIAEMK